MLEGLQPRTVVRPCAVRSILEGLSDSDQKILRDALGNVDAWSNNGLATALGERGLIISDGPIRKHRSKRCTCK